MESSDNISKMSSFLRKVKQLRGFGDMDSYSLVREFKNLVNASDGEIENIIENMASPQTWNYGKNAFIQNVENIIQDIAAEKMLELS
ncbi:hypothetical protein DHW03_17810 [Pedobacter yonginense]|uniref:Uncharacterized protein n=1 Tax=Pedobacter yonginense TaxID=651869 RepID=A0A317EKR7_9SPHI|nr:hypothetical protein [Pedobacter yonginense]PWS26619.1 hypothetical protein DHW03_17810 [Pedobacter yonginense]